VVQIADVQGLAQDKVRLEVRGAGIKVPPQGSLPPSVNRPDFAID
jgi:hypothetical protein